MNKAIEKELQELELNLSMLEKRHRVLAMSMREIDNIKMHIEYIRKYNSSNEIRFGKIRLEI